MMIYVAGPMRGIPHFNFPAFDEAAKFLRAIGHDVFNPADHDRSTYGDDLADAATNGDEAEVETSHGFDLRKALGADLEFITQHADAVAVLPGWENSKGARAEVATALALGLLVLPWALFAAEWEHDLGYDGGSDRVVELPGPAIVAHDTAADTLAAVATSAEVRTVSASGGEKGTKAQRFDLLPPYPLAVLAEHYGKGAAKYDAHNWRRGYEWSNSFAALMRHAWAFWDGEDVDAETGSPHTAAVAFHAFALIQFARDFPEYDDRPGRTLAAYREGKQHDSNGEG